MQKNNIRKYTIIIVAQVFGLPSCVFICALKLQARANLFLQSSQPWGLSPEKKKIKYYSLYSVKFIYCLPLCRNRWFFKFVCFEKPRKQIEHLKGHEPLWTYLWDFKSPGVGNDLAHRLHLCGFSLMWVILW